MPDRWGTRVNSYYANVKYPTDAFVPQDPSPQTQHAYSPIFPLSLGVSDMVEAWPPGTGYRKQECGSVNQPLSYYRLTQETPGNRVLFGVLDYADTAAFLIPSAAILNPAGRYVTPTQRSMAAAVNSMVSDGNKITQEVGTKSKNPAEYPLTMVIYAMVPTSGLSHTKADAIARWLRFVAGHAQQEGTAPGTLPTGYLPLTSKLRAETLTAATAVQDQAGAAKPQPESQLNQPQLVRLAEPGLLGVRVAVLGVSFPKVGQKINTVAVRDPQTAGFLRYALPGAPDHRRPGRARRGVLAAGPELRGHRRPPAALFPHGPTVEEKAVISHRWYPAQARGDRRRPGRGNPEPVPDRGRRDQRRERGHDVTINGSGSSWSEVALDQWSQTCGRRASR